MWTEEQGPKRSMVAWEGHPTGLTSRDVLGQGPQIWLGPKMYQVFQVSDITREDGSRCWAHCDNVL